jgi:hypothetical protein
MINKPLLDFWERTPLNSEETDFSIWITIFDNRLEEGRVPVTDYPIVKLKFEDNKVSDTTVAYGGAYGRYLPDFVGWNKEETIRWLDDYTDIPAVWARVVTWRSVLWVRE